MCWYDILDSHFTVLLFYRFSLSLSCSLFYLSLFLFLSSYQVRFPSRAAKKSGRPVVVGGIGMYCFSFDMPNIVHGIYVIYLTKLLNHTAMDISAKPFKGQNFIPATSNPGKVTHRWGGVGR